MPAAKPEALAGDLLPAWFTNERINQYLIDHLTDAVWTAKPPGGKGRTVAAIFAHMHNVRHMWVQTAGKDLALFAKADREHFARAEARKALAESAASIASVLRKGLDTGRVPGFPAGTVAFFAYVISHDAHHRGQVVMLARQLGHPVPPEAGYGLWEWNTRLKEV